MVAITSHLESQPEVNKSGLPGKFGEIAQMLEESGRSLALSLMRETTNIAKGATNLVKEASQQTKGVLASALDTKNVIKPALDGEFKDGIAENYKSSLKIITEENLPSKSIGALGDKIIQPNQARAITIEKDSWVDQVMTDLKSSTKEVFADTNAATPEATEKNKTKAFSGYKNSMADKYEEGYWAKKIIAQRGLAQSKENSYNRGFPSKS